MFPVAYAMFYLPIELVKEIMFAAFYLLCLIVCVGYFVWTWPQATNKVKSVLGIFFGLIPLINAVLAIVIGIKFYKENK
jgi:L-lactate permease